MTFFFVFCFFFFWIKVGLHLEMPKENYGFGIGIQPNLRKLFKHMMVFVLELLGILLRLQMFLLVVGMDLSNCGIKQKKKKKKRDLQKFGTFGCEFVFSLLSNYQFEKVFDTATLSFLFFFVSVCNSFSTQWETLCQSIESKTHPIIWGNMESSIKAVSLSLHSEQNYFTEFFFSFYFQMEPILNELIKAIQIIYSPEATSVQRKEAEEVGDVAFKSSSFWLMIWIVITNFLFF